METMNQEMITMPPVEVVTPCALTVIVPPFPARQNFPKLIDCEGVTTNDRCGIPGWENATIPERLISKVTIVVVALRKDNCDLFILHCPD